MKVLVEKSILTGEVLTPASKSYTIRGLICAALARGESEIINPLISDDTEAARDVLGNVGVKIQQENGLWRVAGGELHEATADLFCADSAATLRFMTAVCSLIPGKSRLVTGSSLARRPVKTLVQALRQLGVDCSCQGEVAPVTVKGEGLIGGVTELPGDISSQYISALLIASPLAKQEVRIRLTTPVESKPYLMMTLDCMKRFGVNVATSPDLREFVIAPQRYRPTRYRVEGDWSSASYFLAMGALLGTVTVKNLNLESQQGDRIMLDFLSDMGASIELSKSAITVRKSSLNAIQANLSDYTDLLPTLAVIAASACGRSEFSGVARARIKESNRVSALREGLEKMGIAVHEEQDRLTVTGTQPKSAAIDSKNDHRIAMAFSIPGLVAGGTIINDAECVSKTFPNFWEVVRSIGGKVKVNGEQSG
ncbi:MAG: 3-phosphoshikimate 1-carboxyvinyltransferase [Dehalococcoidales bacterium]|nr:3-phosphoshikimate 1-carboxyvinyltransferase [Dehalococcoidales bacterium]